MRPVLAVAMGVALAACAVGLRAQAGTPAAVSDVWGQLVSQNDLVLKGKTPFDLAMTFQLYDLDGKPTQTGSVEEWWAAPGSQKVVVHLAGLNEDGRATERADPALVRDAYLVRQLLEEAVAPVPVKQLTVVAVQTRNGEVLADKTPMKALAAAALTTKRVKLGKVVLDCTTPAVSNAMSMTPTTLCVEPQSTNVLVLQGLGGQETLLRPRTGTFHDTHVAVELRINYLGKDAIVGKLTTMKVWDPASSEIKLPAAVTKSKTEAAPILGGVIAGHRISFVEPQYPDMAKVEHASGAVLLNAIIGKDGRITRLVPIASTEPMFTESAMQAVRGWRYSPYLLNGEPTNVDTTITVNFALSQN